MKIKRLVCLLFAFLMIVCLFTGCGGKKEEREFNTFEDFADARLGVLTGSIFDKETTKLFPESKKYNYDSTVDLLLNLSEDKIDGFLLDRAFYSGISWEKSGYCAIESDKTSSSEFGFVTSNSAKGKKINRELNEFIAEMNKNGGAEKLAEKWFSGTRPTEYEDYKSLTGENGTLIVGMTDTTPPLSYQDDDFLTGFDLEYIILFAREYGYKLKLSTVDFSFILGSVQNGTYDLGIGGITITDERKEVLNFTDPYYKGDIVMVTKDSSAKTTDATTEELGFIDSMKLSFEKTFVREQRWKLIVEGIDTTMFISVLSVLGGTLLGFALYMVTRSKYKWLSKLAKTVAKVYSKIMAGTPTLVVLMLLFYVVFTSPEINGIIIAIVGFILSFGSFVCDNLDLTVSGVDNGQLEAAYALGYSRNKTFFRIILPQAMKMFVPSYSGEIVNLIKSTSVVGFIAVNDLTKMGDIIRGNTYEAFFPLIAVAVIYFAITWIIAALLNILRNKTEPKKRKNKNILKGVER